MNAAPEIKVLPISEVRLNPDNPRIIRDEKFKKLVRSLSAFPTMSLVRPLVIDENNVVLGGNMRLRAMQESGWTEVPVIQVADWSEDKKREFIAKDNIGYGEWNWEVLANEWDVVELEEWGLDVPAFDAEPDYDDLIGDEKNKPATMKITFESPEQLQKAEIDIQELLDRKYPKAYFSVSAGEI